MMKYTVKVLESTNGEPRPTEYEVDTSGIQYFGSFIAFISAGGTENAVFSAHSVLSVTRT